MVREHTSIALVGALLLAALSVNPGCGSGSEDGGSGGSGGATAGSGSGGLSGAAGQGSGGKASSGASGTGGDSGAAGSAGSSAGGGGSCAEAGGSCVAAECCNGLICCSGQPIPPDQAICFASDCPDSDRNLKQDIESADADALLQTLATLPVSYWSYKTEPGVRHLGPMAQDFRAAFGLGASEHGIRKVDADGVAFAAIQALHVRLTALASENARLSGEIAGLRRELGIASSDTCF